MLNKITLGHLKVLAPRTEYFWAIALFFLLSNLGFLSSSVSAAQKPPGKPLIHHGALAHTQDDSSGAVRTNAGFTTNSLYANDDGSTDLVPIGFEINFAGQLWSSLYVNNNGDVTFTQPLSTYTPFSIGSSQIPIIAPFFADVDTRPSGSALVTYGTDTVDGHAAFGVNWVNVGYYAYHMDKLDSFQLVLIDRSDLTPGDFDIEFNYDSLTWETGDASGGQDGFGGTPARAGFSDGTVNSNGWQELPGSGISYALLDGGSNALASHNLDSSQPGRYVFHIRSNEATASLQMLDENDLHKGVVVSGAAADGATQIRVHCEAQAPGTVALVYDGGAVSNTPDGTFVPAPGSIGDLNNLTLQQIGDHYEADAIYTVPEGLIDEATHNVYFQGTYTPQNGEPVTLETQTLQLQRPLVVLLHGLWSSPKTWNGEGVKRALEDSGFTVKTFDYRDTNAAHFHDNAGLLLDDLNSELQAIRTNRVAIARVDLVCHSMGGVIARTMVSDLPGYYANTFGKGLIRRLVTLGTPHEGSPWANLLWTGHNTRIIGSLLDRFFRSMGSHIHFCGPIDEGAIEDLQIGSNALQNMGTTNVPSFALIGDCNPDDNTMIPFIDAAYNACRFFHINTGSLNTSSRTAFVNSVMNGLASDLIVPGLSQQGGLDAAFTQRFSPLVHTTETSSDDMGNMAAGLLSGSVNEFAGGFPTPPLHLSAQQKYGSQGMHLTSDVRALSDTPLITITEPDPNATFHPGDEITITAVPNAGVNVQAVMITIGDGSGHSALVEQAPFTTTFTIADSFVGPLTYTVAARDDAGNVSITDGSNAVQSSATVQSLTVTPSPLTFSTIGATHQLHVTGSFSDGVDREISDPSTGTTYSSDNSNVANVDNNGLVTASGSGNTLIRIRNGSVSTQAVAQVTLQAPSVLSVTPSSVMVGTTTQSFTIQGLFLGGASSIEFLIGDQPDDQVTAENIQVDELGQTLTATLTVTENAIGAAHTVVVTTPGGTSSTVADSGNKLLILNGPSFTASPTTGKSPLTVTFTDTSIMPNKVIKSWSWNFGDGRTGTGKSARHIYSKAGSFDVSLTIKDSTGASYKTTAPGLITVYVPPKASFKVSKTKGTTPFTVNFTDTSQGSITNWYWEFGDNQTSTDKSPTHTYEAAGKYTVKLTTSGPAGSNTKTLTNCITVIPPPPVAAFSATPLSGAIPLGVGFSDESTGIFTKWAWKFGDGGTATTQNPVHTYKKAGTYSVTLKVTGPGGSNTLTKTSYITATR